MGVWSDLCDYLVGPAKGPQVVHTALTRREVLFRLSSSIDQTPAILRLTGSESGKPLRGFVGANGFRVDRYGGPKADRRLVVEGDVVTTTAGSDITYTASMAGSAVADFLPLLPLSVVASIAIWLGLAGDGRAVLAAAGCLAGGALWVALLAYGVQQSKRDYLTFLAMLDDLAERQPLAQPRG